MTPPWQVAIMILAPGADSDGYTNPAEAERRDSDRSTPGPALYRHGARRLGRLYRPGRACLTPNVPRAVSRRVQGVQVDSDGPLGITVPVRVIARLAQTHAGRRVPVLVRVGG